MKGFTVEQYKAAGCPEMERGSVLFVHGVSGGRVCDTGCHAFASGNCGFYRKLVSGVATPTAKVYTETVREDAARLGISIGEVVAVAKSPREPVMSTEQIGPFYIVGSGGFVNSGPRAPDKFWTANLRYAMNFATWLEADDFGRQHGMTWWAILKCAYCPQTEIVKQTS